MPKRRVEKDPVKLQQIAIETTFMNATLSSAEYQEWKGRQPFYWSEASPCITVKDKDGRLMNFFALWAANKHAHLLPRTGWATLREIRKLLPRDTLKASDELEKLILSGKINPGTTRDDIDEIRNEQKKQLSLPRVKPRHRLSMPL